MRGTRRKREAASLFRQASGFTVALLWTLAFVALALFAAVHYRHLTPYATSAISKMTGREFAIRGDVNIRFPSWRPRLVVEKVTFANPSWSKQAQMLEVGRFEIGISLRRLLRGDVVIPRIRLDDAVVRLEERADGSNNWTLSAAEVAAPEDRTDVPAVRRLLLRNTHITYVREGAPESAVDLELASASGSIAGAVRLQGTGRYQKNPAKFSLNAGSIDELNVKEQPFPLDLSLTAGTTTARIKGNLVGTIEEGGLDVTMRIEGQSLSDLYPLIGVVLPKSPPYRLDGKLGHEGSLWTFADFRGRLGDSDLSGDLSVDVAPVRPFMKADLRSNLLDFDDLAGLVGAPAATGAGETASSEQKAEVAEQKASGRVLPDTPVDVPRLQAMDIDARLVATRVNAPNHVPIDRLDLRLSLKDGTLRAQPASFDVANGRVELHTTLYSDRQPLRADLELRASNLEAARILGDTPFTKDTSGKVNGSAKFAMRGNSVREMAATADGDARFTMERARMSHLLVELIGLDVMESLGVLIGGDKSLEVRCAAVDLKATDGTLKSELAVIDTEDTNVTADLTLDLETEMLDLRVVPHPRDASFLSLRQDLRVEGRLADLDYYPDPLKLGRVGGAMQKLNYVLAPVVGLLTPFDLLGKKKNDDSGCLAFAGKQAASPTKASAKKAPAKVSSKATAKAPAKAPTKAAAKAPAPKKNAG